ncbi:hypothetical protein [Rhodoferax ferrireducens]|uniref:hypothetical protein n=1 Tax=Rhodoferax ferrireducens TaxID=192843 RepID=UPI000E0CEA54|nr:hypothetical protein [Rhodoferax ferrireducens]
MNQQLALTPIASATAASTAIKVEVRNLVVTGPDIQGLLSAVAVDMEIAPTMVIDSDDMAADLIEMLGRLATVSAAIETERKERTAPLLDAQKWLMNGYSPARTQLDGLIAAGKIKLTAYNRAKAEAQRIAEEAEAKKRRDAAAAAAQLEAEAIAAAQESARKAEELSKAGSEQAAQAMVTQAMVQVDTARQVTAVAVQAIYTAPVSSYSAPLKGTSGTWSAEVTDKAALVKYIGLQVADGNLALLSLLDVSDKNIKAMAKLQQANLKIPGIKPVFTESISIRKQAVAA